MKHLIGSCLALTVFVCFAQTVFGWNLAGHMATGSIAYRVLKKESPRTVARAVTLIKKNPYYTEKWLALINELNDDDDPDELLFMHACRWADDARNDIRFYPDGEHKDAIHYINQPFKPAGQPEGTKTNEPFEINIVRAYPELIKQVKKETDEKQRGVALCWVMHLVGDAHQPLHTVSLYTEKHQLKDRGRLVGDRGGTWFYVRQSATAKRGEGLHRIWDDFLTSEAKYDGNKKAVLKLLADPNHAPASLGHDLTKIDIETWVAESYELARTKVYFFRGELLKGGTKEQDAAVLPDGYLSESARLAKVRGVVAGYRLAAVLRDALAD